MRLKCGPNYRSLSVKRLTWTRSIELDKLNLNSVVHLWSNGFENIKRKDKTLEWWVKFFSIISFDAKTELRLKLLLHQQMFFLASTDQESKRKVTNTCFVGIDASFLQCSRLVCNSNKGGSGDWELVLDYVIVFSNWPKWEKLLRSKILLQDNKMLFLLICLTRDFKSTAFFLERKFFFL